MAKKKLNSPPTASSSHEGEKAEEQISDDSSPVKSGKKRQSGKTSKEVNAKRSKKVSKDIEKKTVEDTKKPLFQRLWSEEDEISLLQGMIDFKADTGKSPYEDMDGFYELTSKVISFEASRVQLFRKIRSLKEKHMEKVNLWGVESFLKGHDKKCLRLAKHIWGSDGLAFASNGKKLDSLEANADNVEEDREVLVNGEKVEDDREVLVNGEKVEEDTEVLVNGEKVEEDREVLVNGEKVEEVRKVLVNGEKVEEDREVLVNGKKVEEEREVLVDGEMVEEDREVLVDGQKVEEDREVLVDGEKVEEVLVNGEKVEEDKEVFVNGGDSKSVEVMRAFDWFEDSFLVGSIVSLGVSEQFVKQKWSMVGVETKKRMEEKWKLLQAKEMEILLQKTDFMCEVGSVITEAS